MTLIVESTPFAQQMAETLGQRQLELCALLQEAAGALADHSPEVQDFKDVAAQETRAVIDEVACSHAADELTQVVAALRRIDEGGYGVCRDCGEPVDERRLRALPATPFCTACQTIHEHRGTPRR